MAIETRTPRPSTTPSHADVRRPLCWDLFSGAKVRAWWLNPRDGSAKLIGEFPNTGEREFLSPDKGEHLDWVLVLDDAAKGFPAPGSRNLH